MLIRSATDKATCTRCGCKDLRKLFSPFGFHSKGGDFLLLARQALRPALPVALAAARAAIIDSGDQMGDLDKLYKDIVDCSKCTLCQGRTNLVFGVGNEKADVVFVGEAPGYYEDKEGEPFVGSAGQLLNKLLASIGFRREDIYIANILKCRPPGNRDPLPEEIEACKPLLFKQLEIIGPKIVVTLGSFAARTILGRTVSMSKIHAQPVEADNYLIFPTYHPAAALYTRATMALLEEDFRALKELLDKKPAPVKAKPSQLGLF